LKYSFLLELSDLLYWELVIFRWFWKILSLTGEFIIKTRLMLSRAFNVIDSWVGFVVRVADAESGDGV